MANCSFLRNKNNEWAADLDEVSLELEKAGLPPISDTTRWQTTETEGDEILTFEGTLEEADKVQAIFERVAYGPPQIN